MIRSTPGSDSSLPSNGSIVVLSSLTIRGAPVEQYGNVRRLEAAVLDIARSVWNTYYAPYFGVKDSPIVSLYIPFIGSSLYLKIVRDSPIFSLSILL
jgi:hypothetical protein